MRRNTKLITTILTMVMVLPFFLGLGSAKGIDAEATEEATLVLHKKKMIELPDPIQNTGEEMDGKDGLFSGYDPLPGVTFHVYDVTDSFYENYIAKDGKTAQEAAIDEVKGLGEKDLGEPAFKGTTNESGEITLNNVPKKSGEQDAVYLIVEQPKDGVTVAERMVLAFPVYEMTTAGKYTDTELNTIHLYPKNVVATDGSLIVNKKGTAEGESINGAEFIISRNVGNETQYLSGAAGGIFTWTKNKVEGEDSVGPFKFFSGQTYTISDAAEAVKGILAVEKNDGKLNIAGFEYGNYILTETEAPKGAGLIEEDYTFVISSEKKSASFDVENDTSIIEKKIPTAEANGISYGIGEAIDYEISTNIPKGIARQNTDGTNYYTKFELKDTHDKVLSFIEGNYKLVIRDKNGGETIVPETTGYTINHVTGTGSTDDFTVSIAEAYIPSLTPGAKLVFKYQMALNDTANPDTGYNNTASVTTNHTSDTSEPVIVKTGGKRFLKVDVDNQNYLAGAEFIVARGEGDAREYLAVNDAKELIWETNKTAAKVFTSSSTNGLVDVAGLKYGDYFLIEIKAPDDYVLPTKEVDFTISDGSYGVQEDLATAQPVPNKHRGSLPSTGGSGIVAFVLIGVVAVGGAVLYFTKGRRQIEG